MAADGSIVINTEIDNKNAQKELNRLNRQIQSLEGQLRSKTSGRLPLEENLNAVNARLEEAKKNLAYLQDEQYFINEAMKPGSSAEDYIAASANKDEVERNLKEQESKVEAIQKEWDKANQKLEVYDRQIADTNLKLEEAKAQAGGLQKQMAMAAPAGDSVSGSASKMGAAMERAKKSAEGFATRLKGVVTSALVFTVVSQGLAKFREWMGRVIQTNDEASAAMARLRGSLLTLAQPLVNVLIPAFTTLVNVLTRIVSIAAQIVSSLFGTTVEQSAEAAENLYNESNAIEDVSSTAKKAGKSLAGFDEINQLSGDQPSGGAGGGASAGGTAPDFTGLVKNSLSGISELFTGIFLVALGAVLTFTGAHIFLGIGMMVAGAMLVWDAITSDGGNLASQLVETGLNNVLTTIGPLIAVIGVLFIVMGRVLLGIGLMLLGITLWSVGEAAGEEGDFVENIKTKLAEAAAAIGPWLAIIGVVFLLLGHLGIGIALIITGIALFVAGEVGLNWELLQTDIVQALSNIAEAIAPWLAILGIIFLFVPGMQPVGIGLIVAGLALFTFSKIAPNWDLIVKQIQDVLGKIKKAVSDAWNWLDDFTHGFLSDIFGAFDEIFGGLIDFIAGVFSGDWERAWEGVKSIFQGIWDGLIAIAKAPINAIIGLINGAIDAINWIIDGINSISFDMPDWLGGAHIGFSIGKIGKIPYLAQGAVIPPNREFLAVLGDQRRGNNIEAPEGLLRQLIREESGSNEVVQLLQSILEATRARQKMYVKQKVLAEIAKDGINDMTIAAGRSVLLY